MVKNSKETLPALAAALFILIVGFVAGSAWSGDAGEYVAADSRGPVGACADFSDMRGDQVEWNYPVPRNSEGTLVSVESGGQPFCTVLFQNGRWWLMDYGGF